MEDYIKKSIFDLLFYGRTSLAETQDFQELKHNKDLVPRYNDKLNDILAKFDRYHRISYDVQGIKDKGIDVLVKYEFEDEYKLIGVQIKSYDDLKDEKWLQILKAQVTDVMANYRSKNLVDFYIAFCTDATQDYNKVRNATADLIGIKDLHILAPDRSLYFMNLADYEISSYLKRKLSDDDPVVVDARESLAGLSLAQAAMVIEAASYFIENGKREFEHTVITESSFVLEMYDRYPNIPFEEYEVDDKKIKKLFGKGFPVDIISDFQSLYETYIDMLTYSESYIFNHEQQMALISIMYESMARFYYTIDEIKWHTFTLLMDDEIKIANKVKNQRVD